MPGDSWAADGHLVPGFTPSWLRELAKRRIYSRGPRRELAPKNSVAMSREGEGVVFQGNGQAFFRISRTAALGIVMMVPDSIISSLGTGCLVLSHFLGKGRNKLKRSSTMP